MGNDESIPALELRREMEREPDFIVLCKRAQRMKITIRIQDKDEVTVDPGKTVTGTLTVPLPSSYENIPETISRAAAALSARAIAQGYLEFGYQSSSQ